MKTALLQMDIKLYDKEANKMKAANMIKETMEKNPDVDLFVLPELWTFPFLFKERGKGPKIEEQLAEYGETLTGETAKFVSELAARYKVWIAAGSLPVRHEDGAYRNTCVIFDREGKIVGDYSKVHLCGWCEETGAFANGGGIKVFPTEIGILSPIICYDIRFPELARSAALKGADLLVVAADFGHKKENPKIDIWRTLLKARAIENMMFVAACDRCGTGPENEYFGHSMIVDPFGRVIAEGQEGECVVVGEIDYNLAEEARSAIPVLKDRRPEAYVIN